LTNEDSPQRTLAGFASETTFEDLPEEVVHQTKRVILDTIGCAVGGYKSDIGRLARKLLEELGGKPESTVIGSGDKTSCTNAAYANSRMAYALDFDECFLGNTHLAASAVMAALAVGEREKSTGKELIEAVAVGYDVAARIGRSLGSSFDAKAGTVEARGVSGSSWITFGPIVSSGKILGLNEEQMNHAVGIGGMNSPLPTRRKVLQYGPVGKPLPHVKYFDQGWAAQVGATAALCAKLGMTGPTTLLDGPYGLWRILGYSECRFDFMTERLGQDWYIMETSFKPYPCCRGLHPTLYLTEKIINEHRITPDEIESIRAKVNPMNVDGSWLYLSSTAGSAIDLQFNLAYCIAMVVLGTKPGPDWQSLERFNDPKVKEIMRLVKLEANEEYFKKMLELQREHLMMKKRPTSVEIFARGKKFSDSLEHTKGDPWDPTTYISDKELADKFRTNAISFSDASSWRNCVEESIEHIFHTEKTTDLRELIPHSKSLSLAN